MSKEIINEERIAAIGAVNDWQAKSEDRACLCILTDKEATSVSVVGTKHEITKAVIAAMREDPEFGDLLTHTLEVDKLLSGFNDLLKKLESK